MKESKRELRKKSVSQTRTVQTKRKSRWRN